MKKDSFTLVEVLVGTFLILIVFLGIFGLYQLALKVIAQSERKITATALANQEMEKIRNLAYSDAGTRGRTLPFASGVLENSTSTRQNNVEYLIEKEVKYVVDSADGQGAEDSCNWDYKKAEVKVSWSGRFAGSVKAISDIAPKNKVEEVQTCALQPGGILSISVFDAQGLMVPNPMIEVFNPSNGSLIDFATPLSGKYDFPLATATYKAVVSKSGFSRERTYGQDEITTPEKPHPLVIEGKISEVSFSIDRLSSMTVETRGTAGQGYRVIHDAAFNLRGSKIIGLNAQENPVYKYSQNQTTDGPGEILISNLEWDAYYFSALTAGLDLVEIESPPGGATTSQPINLSPNTGQPLRLILQSENSLLVTVRNLETLEPVFSASTTLANGTYQKTQFTDQNGQTFFIPLAQDTYNLAVQAAGYLATTSAISVSGDVTTTVKIQQIE